MKYIKQKPSLTRAFFLRHRYVFSLYVLFISLPSFPSGKKVHPDSAMTTRLDMFLSLWLICAKFFFDLCGEQRHSRRGGGSFSQQPHGTRRNESQFFLFSDIAPSFHPFPLLPSPMSNTSETFCWFPPGGKDKNQTSSIDCISLSSSLFKAL